MEIFKIMILFGGLAFMSFGICVANSIEARENKVIENILTALTAISALLFLVGLFGIIIT